MSPTCLLVWKILTSWVYVFSSAYYMSRSNWLCLSISTACVFFAFYVNDRD